MGALGCQCIYLPTQHNVAVNRGVHTRGFTVQTSCSNSCIPQWEIKISTCISLRIACNPANTPYRTRTIPPALKRSSHTHRTIRAYLQPCAVCKRVSIIAARPSSLVAGYLRENVPESIIPVGRLKLFIIIATSLGNPQLYTSLVIVMGGANAGTIDEEMHLAKEALISMILLVQTRSNHHG